jgi:hypothetical protein
MSGWGEGPWGSSTVGWGGVLVRSASGSLGALAAAFDASTRLPPYGSGILVIGLATFQAQAGAAIVTVPTAYFSTLWELSDLVWSPSEVTWGFETILFSSPSTAYAPPTVLAAGEIVLGPATILNSYPGLDIGYGLLESESAQTYPDTPYELQWDVDAVQWDEALSWGGGLAFVYANVTGTITVELAGVTAFTERRVVGSAVLQQGAAGYSGEAAVLRSASGALVAGESAISGAATRWFFVEVALQAQPACGFTYWIKFNKSRRSTWTPVDDRQPNVCSGGGNA